VIVATGAGKWSAQMAQAATNAPCSQKLRQPKSAQKSLQPCDQRHRPPSCPRELIIRLGGRTAAEPDLVNPMQFEVRFKLEKETRGALRYLEVDENGEVIELPWTKIGSLYVRKSAFERDAAYPQALRIVVETVDLNTKGKRR
jgi:hypothetical protein